MSRPASRSPAGSTAPPPKSRPGYTGPNDDQGRPHGVGVQRYQDGSRYEGDFVHGVIHGRGVYRYASGARYVGRFTNGLRGPKGTYTFACGTTYEGEYENDTRTGNGAMTFSATAGASIRAARRGGGCCPVLGPQAADAAKFTGSFVNGHMQGSGTLTFAPPITMQTSMSEGLRSTDHTDPDNQTSQSAGTSQSAASVPAAYTGAMDTDLEHGHGVLVCNAGETRIEGTFAFGAPSGECTVLHVKSGERCVIGFDEKTALPVSQRCSASPDSSAACNFDKGGPRCSACNAARREQLSDWLTPPPAFEERVSPVQRPPSANARPKSAAAGGRGEPAGPGASGGGGGGDLISSDDGDDEVIDLDDDDDDAEEDDLGFQTPPAAATKKKNARPTTATGSRGRELADESAAVNARVRLLALEERVGGLLREARPGMGMAIADCAVKHDDPTGSPQRSDTAPTEVRIVQVAPHSAASRSGFARGDYVLRVDGVPIRKRADFASMAFTAGDSVAVTIRRRHPMTSAVDTPNRQPSPGRSAAVGDERTVDVVVGCTVGPEAVRALESIRGSAANALAAVEEAGHDTAAGVSESELAEWERTVASIHPSRFPEAW